MATKKTTTKRAPAKKKPAVQTSTKSTGKKAPKASVQPKSRVTKHIKLQRSSEDFMTFRVNRETVYWMVLGGVVILFAMWILQLQADIQKLYDEIDASSATYSTLDAVELEMAKKKN